MKRYETVFIADPDITEDLRVQLFEKVKTLNTAEGGVLLEFDDWGNKKLAYEIRKKTRGYYVKLDYCGEGTLVKEMERSFKIDERILRFLTILLDNDADIESIQKNMFEKKDVGRDNDDNDDVKDDDIKE